MRVGVAGLLLLVVTGCGPSGPTTTDTSSESLPTLAERVEFLQRYVTFHRTYRELDFRIEYRDNSRGLVPGPSDWDIRLVAVVPPEELAAWVPPGVEPVRPTTAETSWLADVPGAERSAGITEWYGESGRMVGIDRARSVVAYRLSSMP